MTLQVDIERLLLAHKAVQAELLAERNVAGHWVGEVSSSPLATATAISALVLAHETGAGAALLEKPAGETGLDSLVQTDLSELIVEALHWLARFQNQDGGWGDATGGRSNLAATLLVQAAFRLTGVPAKYARLIDRADEYVLAHGGIPEVRYQLGRERLAAAPMLANCALAGMLPWRQVPTLPFELVCVPGRWAERLRLPLAAVELPALVAVGHAKFRHDPPRNPLSRVVRQAVRSNSLALLERMQSPDGSYFGATPLTAYVVMCLASIGEQRHPAVERGVEFLLSTMRGDASWPVVTDLAIGNTALAIDALTGTVAAGGPLVAPSRDQRSRLDGEAVIHPPVHDAPVSDQVIRHAPGLKLQEVFDPACLEWLLDRQHTNSDAVVRWQAGGWGWSATPGMLASVDDTASVLLVLAQWREWGGDGQREQLERAARSGVAWLLGGQNDDGGWPVVRGARSALGFHRSAEDITAQVVRALAAWKRIWQQAGADSVKRKQSRWRFQVTAATDRAICYLAAQQRVDGSFVGRRFGNQYHTDGQNPLCATARVLRMCEEIGQLDTEMARRAVRWLLSAQHTGGGWGPPRAPLDYSGTSKNGAPSRREKLALAQHASVEETAQAVTALLPLAGYDAAARQAASKGLEWLITAIEQDRQATPAVIGFFFDKLAYHERLYPIAFAAQALASAVRQLAPVQSAVTTVG